MFVYVCMCIYIYIYIYIPRVPNGGVPMQTNFPSVVSGSCGGNYPPRKYGTRTHQDSDTSCLIVCYNMSTMLYYNILS